MIKDSAKTIVCYGDSNAWGNIPHSDRYPRSIRWTVVLQELLGNEYEVINEGLCGRTLVAEDPAKPFKTGITHLKSILRTNHPLELIIIMLGTNDIKNEYGLNVEDIARHLEQTIDLIKKEEINNILVVCPPDIIIPESGIVDTKYINSFGKIEKLSKLFKEVSEKYKCSFIDAGDYVSSSKIDGFHLDPDAHKKLAEVFKIEVLKILK